MLNAFVLLVARANSADTFIAECGRAVRSVKEGRLGFEVRNEGQSEATSYVLKNDASVMRVSIDGKPYCDILSTPTRLLAVQYASRQYSDSTFPASPPKGPEPLVPLKTDTFDFALSPDRGFVFRSNPEFTEAKVSATGPQETLVASVKAKGKEKLGITLTRNAKTKLPIGLVVRILGKESETMRFYCEPRAVTEAELTLEPASYAGFTKVDSIEDSAG